MRRKRIKIEGPVEKTSFNLPVQLLEDLERVSGTRGITQVAAVVEALSEWTARQATEQQLAASGTVTTPPLTLENKSHKETQLSHEEQACIQRLLAVLRSGNQIVVSAIEQNLMAFGLIVGQSHERGTHDAIVVDLPPRIASAIESSKRTRARADVTAKKHTADPHTAPGSGERTG